MADYLEHSERWRTHKTPHTPAYHWGSDEGVAVRHFGTAYPDRCEMCRPDPEPAHPLTPADPHPHAWDDLGKPGLHGSVCRLCGETQID